MGCIYIYITGLYTCVIKWYEMTEGHKDLKEKGSKTGMSEPGYFRKITFTG